MRTRCSHGTTRVHGQTARDRRHEHRAPEGEGLSERNGGSFRVLLMESGAFRCAWCKQRPKGSGRTLNPTIQVLDARRWLTSRMASRTPWGCSPTRGVPTRGRLRPPMLAGQNLREERRARLRKALRGSDKELRFRREAIFRRACALGLGGIVLKRSALAAGNYDLRCSSSRS